MSKGSKQRPHDKAKYDSEYDRIFRAKKVGGMAAQLANDKAEYNKANEKQPNT